VSQQRALRDAGSLRNMHVHWRLHRPSLPGSRVLELQPLKFFKVQRVFGPSDGRRQQPACWRPVNRFRLPIRRRQHIRLRPWSSAAKDTKKAASILLEN
jgi:hypothetical protein